MAADPASLPEPDDSLSSDNETKPTIPLTTPIREANGLITYMGSDGRRYVVFGAPPDEENRPQGQA